MKKILVTILVCIAFGQGRAQNSIAIDAGYLFSHTSVAEYVRTGRFDNLLDSVSLQPNLSSFQAAFRTNIDLGRRFFLSAGFHYAMKGMSEVAFSDTATTYFVKASQHYVGLSLIIEYHYAFKNSKFGLIAGTGPQVDFAVGKPNNGVLYSGPYSKFFMPFSRFSETDLSWVVTAGGTYKLGPGDVQVKLAYLYGLSDVLEDPYVVGRSMSFGITAGYALRLGK
jgi:hypothetical protein